MVKGQAWQRQDVYGEGDMHIERGLHGKGSVHGEGGHACVGACVLGLRMQTGGKHPTGMFLFFIYIPQTQ